MGQVCEEAQVWIEEEIEKPIETWENQQKERCDEQSCNWWTLCLNKLVCYLVWVLVKVVRWVVVTVGKWVVRVVCEIVNGLLNIIGIIAGLILSIPYLGRLIRQLWDFLIDLVWQLVGVFGLIFDLLGLDWEKKLRVCVVILHDERGPLASPSSLDPTIQAAKAAYSSAANVKLVIEDVHTVAGISADRILDVHCDFGAWTDDVGLTGSYFEFTALRFCADGSGRRLIGLASAVVVFAVRDVEPDKGCSLGPFSDYVTIEAKDPVCFAHELAHACSPIWQLHHDDVANLLHKSCQGTELTKWQKIWIRNSRHVTYL